MSGGTFALIGILIAIIIRTNKEFGIIESKKIRYTHVGLMIFTMLITSLSLNVLIAMIFNFEAVFETINIEVGFLSPLMNIILWGSITILNVIVLFSIFSVAGRLEIGRKILIALLPTLLVLGVIRSISEIISKSTPETSVSLAVGLIIIFLSISYLPMFFFYKNNNVRNTIFNNKTMEPA